MLRSSKICQSGRHASGVGRTGDVDSRKGACVNIAFHAPRSNRSNHVLAGRSKSASCPVWFWNRSMQTSISRCWKACLRRVSSGADVSGFPLMTMRARICPSPGVRISSGKMPAGKPPALLMYAPMRLRCGFRWTSHPSTTPHG